MNDRATKAMRTSCSGGGQGCKGEAAAAHLGARERQRNGVDYDVEARDVPAGERVGVWREKRREVGLADVCQRSQNTLPMMLKPARAKE